MSASRLELTQAWWACSPFGHDHNSAASVHHRATQTIHSILQPVDRATSLCIAVWSSRWLASIAGSQKLISILFPSIGFQKRYSARERENARQQSQDEEQRGIRGKLSPSDRRSLFGKYERGTRLGYLPAISDRFSNGCRANVFQQEFCSISHSIANNTVEGIN